MSSVRTASRRCCVSFEPMIIAGLPALMAVPSLRDHSVASTYAAEANERLKQTAIKRTRNSE